MKKTSWIVPLVVTACLAWVGIGLAQNSPGGAFQTAVNYVIGAQWTWRGTTSPFLFEGVTDDAFETTFTITEPTADRTWTFSNVTDTVVGLVASQTLTNKTLTAPVLSGSVTGTYTLAGTPTLTSPTLTTPTLTNPTISGQTPVNVTGATVTLGATHVGRMTTLNRAAGIAVTLPAATGTGDSYVLHVGTTFTGASTVKVNATPGTDVMQGTAVLFADGGDTVVGFATGATADTIDLLGTGNSTGGIVGATITMVDSASGIWSVRYVSDAAGTEATPFSATVP